MLQQAVGAEADPQLDNLIAAFQLQMHELSLPKTVVCQGATEEAGGFAKCTRFVW